MNTARSLAIVAAALTGLAATGLARAQVMDVSGADLTLNGSGSLSLNSFSAPSIASFQTITDSSGASVYSGSVTIAAGAGVSTIGAGSLTVTGIGSYNGTSAGTTSNAVGQPLSSSSALTIGSFVYTGTIADTAGTTIIGTNAGSLTFNLNTTDTTGTTITGAGSGTLNYNLNTTIPSGTLNLFGSSDLMLDLSTFIPVSTVGTLTQVDASTIDPVTITLPATTPTQSAFKFAALMRPETIASDTTGSGSTDAPIILQPDVPQQVPEPSTWALFLGGLACLAMGRRLPMQALVKSQE